MINKIQLMSATQTILNALPAEQRNLLEAALKNGELDRGILEKANAFVFSLNYKFVENQTLNTKYMFRITDVNLVVKQLFFVII